MFYSVILPSLPVDVSAVKQQRVMNGFLCVSRSSTGSLSGEGPSICSDLEVLELQNRAENQQSLNVRPRHILNHLALILFVRFPEDNNNVAAAAAEGSKDQVQQSQAGSKQSGSGAGDDLSAICARPGGSEETLIFRFAAMLFQSGLQQRAKLQHMNSTCSEREKDELQHMNTTCSEREKDELQHMNSTSS
ncbi:uncharacterized protein V6R79_019510 [Siganus canaliculatus]